MSKLFFTKDEDLYDKTIEDVFDDEVFRSDFWLYWRTMFAFENWHSALEMKRYFQRFIHHIGGLPDFSALKFTRYNQYESLILPMQKYLEAAGVEFRFGTEVTNVRFEIKDGKKTARAIECRTKNGEMEIPLTEKDLVFITNGSCTEGTIYGDQDHAPLGDAEVRSSGCWSLWKKIAAQDPAFGHPEKFCSDIEKTNWESATVTTSNEEIVDQIKKICRRDPRTGKVVTGGIVSCRDSSWLLSWTINRQGQFKAQDKDEICVWVYSLFTDVPGDYVKKPMRACTGKEITEEWLYHLGIPEDQIEELAENHANCTPTMMPYITAFFMPRRAGDRPDVIPDGCVNAAFLGQFAETPRDTIFTTEYSVRTAMEAVYGLCGVDRGVPEVWGSVYDIRELLDSTVKLMDGRSPLEMKLPMPFEALKKPILRKIDKTVIGKLLRDHGVLNTMTDNLPERNTLLSVNRVFSGAGVLIYGVVLPILISENVGMSASLAIATLSIFSALTMVPLSLNCKERNYKPEEEDENFSPRQMFSYLGKNKYLLPILAAVRVLSAALKVMSPVAVPLIVGRMVPLAFISKKAMIRFWANAAGVCRAVSAR